MRELRISRKADNDLVLISQYTTTEFGRDQARKYLGQLKACFASLLDNPHLGQSAEPVVPHLRRIRQGAHVIFYISAPDGILIVRVLHQSMDFERHL
ncbi:MAG: type II toxin-antitoxin system RelE/ParE family toxin [Porphyrobacter sp. IPPAS B-1204]|nr:MAG: type II toxin-antitoxin system RelE/ParE family toxin [Porphyrobacter sp. IPPAS B-1204]